MTAGSCVRRHAATMVKRGIWDEAFDPDSSDDLASMLAQDK
jgi:hypothetical protein